MFEGSLSRSMSTTEGVDSELVPSSLASFVAPILRVANEMEKDNPRVAYLCRFHAFDKAHTMDPTATGRGVWQFKTYMLDRLKKEEQQTKPQLANSDPKEIQKFYQNFYEKNIREGQYTKKPEEMAKIYQIATVLYDVLRTVVPATKVDAQTREYAKDVEENKEQYEDYYTLPLFRVGNKPAMGGVEGFSLAETWWVVFFLFSLLAVLSLGVYVNLVFGGR